MTTFPLRLTEELKAIVTARATRATPGTARAILARAGKQRQPRVGDRQDAE